jgi:hypothetical protein
MLGISEDRYDKGKRGNIEKAEEYVPKYTR